jgi:hypothetical protein
MHGETVKLIKEEFAFNYLYANYVSKRRMEMCSDAVEIYGLERYSLYKEYV